MVRTHKNSSFVLYNLENIRNETNRVILQIEDTGTHFADNRKCFLCEVVSRYEYNLVRDESTLINEICKLNNEKRALEKKIRRLEKEMEGLRK